MDAIEKSDTWEKEYLIVDSPYHYSDNLFLVITCHISRPDFRAISQCDILQHRKTCHWQNKVTSRHTLFSCVGLYLPHAAKNTSNNSKLMCGNVKICRTLYQTIRLHQESTGVLYGVDKNNYLSMWEFYIGSRRQHSIATKHHFQQIFL